MRNEFALFNRIERDRYESNIRSIYCALVPWEYCRDNILIFIHYDDVKCTVL